MNIINREKLLNKLKFRLSYLVRKLEIKPHTKSFSKISSEKINRIYVINLDRKPKRWNQIKKELGRLYINNKENLLSLTRRFSAIDARYLDSKSVDSNLLKPRYSLGDQLRVEPNDKIKNDSENNSIMIDMTSQEIAVTLSHIEIWKLITKSEKNFTLILEDDVYFKYNFSNEVDSIWDELYDKNKDFDILFLSYEHVKSVKNEKRSLNRNNVKVDRVSKGIWQASGYVLSKKGAEKLLKLLPVYGPVDLWLNLMFGELEAYISERPIIVQRIDVPSTNSYSIMPIFSRLGVYTGNEQTQFIKTRLKQPVFVFGEENSGLTSIANALMVLGYTCFYNQVNLPSFEEERFFSKKEKNYFNSYINITYLKELGIDKIASMYPEAKFIFTYNTKKFNIDNPEISHLHVPSEYQDKWELLCDFLDMEYPAIPFPETIEQKINDLSFNNKAKFDVKGLEFDVLPWIVCPKNYLNLQSKNKETVIYNNSSIMDKATNFDIKQWNFRNDTFPSNLALFKPENVVVTENNIELHFKNVITTVRPYTSGALVTKNKYLYGKFKVELRPSNISGIITGVFLHRNSPHQEIDIEFLGKDTTKMLVNVFFNPGIEGSKLEYGYRGTPVAINLGFDASENYHLYEIHWEKDSIKWLVDGNIVYERIMYVPTPIPYLPMEFNINLWHSQSEELAGKLDFGDITISSSIRRIEIEF